MSGVEGIPPVHGREEVKIPRNEILHRVLAMVAAGWATRKHGLPLTGWDIEIDHRPAPDNARWALTALTEMRLIIWWDVGSGIHLATPTPRGCEQLRAWDTDLLGTPVTSSRPLTGMGTAELDAEVARLIGTVNFPDTPKDPS